MLILRPKGRGNWAVLRVTIDDERAPPLLFRIGSTLVLAGITFRICEVRA